MATLRFMVTGEQGRITVTLSRDLIYVFFLFLRRRVTEATASATAAAAWLSTVRLKTQFTFIVGTALYIKHELS
jgi:hypothetical protein